jgi:probable glucitol transport protein GutA
MKEKALKNNFHSGVGERLSYGFYFLGQNIFYMLVLQFLMVYFTDMAIPAAAVAVITLIVKVWDAVNDPIFGGMIDRIHFKKGKFLPWLRISLVAIPAATIFLFAMQPDMPFTLKIVWAGAGYILWDMAYTVCDVPIFGLVTTVTDNPHERNVFISIGRVLGIVAALVVAVLIGGIRHALGGWFGTTVVLSIAGLITMLPVCFIAKERFMPPAGEKEIGLAEMFRYIIGNKYILIFYGAVILWRGLSIDQGLGMYIARYNLGSEAFVMISSFIGVIPMMIFSALVPALTKKFDKFTLYFWSIIVYTALSVLAFFAGYKNITLYYVMYVIRTLASSMVFSLVFFFTPDFAEYGRYKSGISAPGITFSIQTFSVKLMAAISTAAAAAVLGIIGFAEGEGAVQAAGFADKLWAVNMLVPIGAALVSIPILLKYKLRDNYVKVMTDCNNGRISRAEAEKQLPEMFNTAIR